MFIKMKKLNITKKQKILLTQSRIIDFSFRISEKKNYFKNHI